MAHFYYNEIIEKMGRDNIRLCMTDTDSLLIEIKNKDMCEFEL